MRRRARWAAAGVTALYALAPPAGVAGAAQSPLRHADASAGTVRGEVVVQGTGAPVAGATIALPGAAASTRSDAEGRFAFAQPIRTEAPYRPITAVVTAPGRAPWRIEGAPLYPHDALILHVELGRMPFVHRVPAPGPRAAIDGAAVPPSGDRTPMTGTCTGWDYQLTPPPTIWVYRTKTGVSEQYDFVFYATHVLPNEWISSWDADSLGAGAIAVRTYAAWHTMTGHAYSSGDNCADVRDTIDGLFDPTWTTAAAQQAVYATWGSILYQNRGLFLTHYFAGTRQDPCAYVTGQYAGWMSQWGSQTCALAGEVWPDIADTFYDSDSTPTSWHYTRNLELDPSIGNDALYAFKAFNATFTRTKGTGADGAWYLALVPTPGKVATLYQHRAFLGTETTQYHDEVWLRCATSQPAACAVTLRVIAFPDGSKNGVARELKVSVPKDGVWHQYTFDPAPHGVAHVFVRVAVVASVSIDVDRFLLTAPYGGP